MNGKIVHSLIQWPAFLWDEIKVKLQQVGLHNNYQTKDNIALLKKEWNEDNCKLPKAFLPQNFL